MKGKKRTDTPPAEKSGVPAELYVQIEERINKRNAITCKKGSLLQDIVKTADIKF